MPKGCEGHGAVGPLNDNACFVHVVELGMRCYVHDIGRFDSGSMAVCQCAGACSVHEECNACLVHVYVCLACRALCMAWIRLCVDGYVPNAAMHALCMKEAM